MSTWLNLTSSLLARALITDAGCMTERPKLSHNRESPHHADAQLPLLTIDLTADRGELTSFLFSLQTGELTCRFFFLSEKRDLETFHSHVGVSIPLSSNRGTVMEMIAFVYLA